MAFATRLWAALAIAAGMLAGPALAQAPAPKNAVAAGAFHVERPTLISLGFDWRIAGDDNRNAKVEVAYRKKGDSAWKTGMPLMRSQNEMVGLAPGPGGPDSAGRFPLFKYRVANMFGGSIFNLEPDTEYECRFTLTDPDGVSGKAVQTVTVRTRKEPMPATGGHVFHVYPVDWKGPKQEPAFTGLMSAYYMGTAHSDYENAFPPRVQPGDVILVHAGLYVGDRKHYLNQQPHAGYLALGDYFDGTYYLTQSGTADKPIVIKGAGDGEVVFDGDGAQYLFNLMGANYNYFEGITVRNTEVAFLLGIKNIAGSSGFTLKHSKVLDVGRVVQDDWSGSKDFYIADNVFNGRHDPDHMMGWTGPLWSRFPEYPEVLLSEYAVKVYGQGHVVAHNLVTNWHDGIDVATYGTPDGAPDDIADRFPESIDFYGNDISNMGDNCFESDGGGRNIRIFANRCFNSAHQALSVQPMFGGPVYFMHNLIYNEPMTALKYIEGSSGIITLNNTIIGEGKAGPSSNETYRNNLFLAQGAAEPVISIDTFTPWSSSDYNGYRPNPGVADAFEWGSYPTRSAIDFTKPPPVRKFPTLQAFADATGQEKHSVLVDYDVFQNVRMPDRSDPRRVYKTADFDFRLKPGSAAVDAGVVIPNVTDGYTGKAPDLGAYELDQPLPQYGPRP
jgi:hypothetical protein